MRGSGTVYKKTRLRKDGGVRTFYVAQIRVEVNGKTRRIEGQGKTPNAAVLARGRAVARAMEGTTRHPQSTTRDGTLLAAMTDWNDRREIQPRTREHTASVIKNHVAPERIGGMMLRAVRSADIQLLLTTRESAWTRVAVYKNLRAFFTYALQGGLLRTDPMKTIARPPMPRAKLANGPSMDRVVKRLKGTLAWMRSTGLDKSRPELWARIMIALDGLRPGEARGLRWGDLQDLNGKNGTPRAVVSVQLGYANRELRLTPVKGGTPRTVVLREGTAEALRAWKKVRDGLRRRKTWHPREGFEDLVFCLEDGRPMRQQEDDEAWRALLEEAQKTYGAEKRIFWSMAFNRHVAVSLMRDAGVPASLVSTIMGHTIAVEDRHYYQSQTAAQREAMDKMDDWLNENTMPHKTKVAREKIKVATKAATQNGTQSPSER